MISGGKGVGVIVSVGTGVAVEGTGVAVGWLVTTGLAHEAKSIAEREMIQKFRILNSLR